MAAIKGMTLVDGKQVEVELVGVPAGLITEEDFGVRFRTELDRRAVSISDKMNEKLLDDEDFFNKAVAKRGVEVVKKGTKKDGPDADTLKALRETWDRENLTPLNQRIGALTDENQGLLADKMDGEILAAAGPLLKDSMLAAPTEGGLAPIIAMLRPALGYDPKSKMWAVKKGDGFEFAAKATDRRPYKGARELVEDWAKNPANGDFIRTTGQRGPGMGGGGVTVNGRTVTISREDAKDVQVYRHAKAEAAKQGMELVIAPE